LSVYFNDLSKVKEFSEFIYKRADAKNNAETIQFDDGKVKEKENYYFLSMVTKIIATLLIIFSTLAVCLFIFNLLNTHLSKVKMNIGTFKAIGLTDKESRSVYFKIIMFFILISIFISICLAILFGYVINYFLISNTVKSSEIDYFKLFNFSEFNSLVNYITTITLFIIIISTGFISVKTIRKILSRSPGDLIYNR
jgi:ABC-type antimicrobial peptide transport system permease subunit